MKKLNLIVFGAIMLSFTSLILFTCSNKNNSENVPEGSLTLNVGITVSVFDVYNSLKAATANFSVIIFNASDEVVVDYAHLSDVPDSIDLPAGNYYAIVSSGNNPDAAFEEPYYMGNSGYFTITPGQTTAANITCALTNIMVTVIYSNNVKSSYSSYSTNISNSGGELLFAENETRAGFFNTGPLHIESSLEYTDRNGDLQTKTLTGDIQDPQTGKHYEIHIDAALTNGNGIINVFLNDTAETEVVNINEGGQSSGGLGYGDLLITEIMYDPDSLNDSYGEWIELYNNSSNAINLKNLIIRRDSAANVHQINSDVIITSGSYAVLAKTDSAADQVDYVYGSAINLTNTGADLSLSTYGTDGTDGMVICEVDYGADGFITTPHGKSLQLDPSVTDVDAAKLGTNWCVSTAVYSTGDNGTPGAANTNCTP